LKESGLMGLTSVGKGRKDEIYPIHSRESFERALMTRPSLERGKLSGWLHIILTKAVVNRGEKLRRRKEGRP